MLPGFAVPAAAAGTCTSSDVSWSSSSNTLYVNGTGASCTLTQLAGLTAAPITLVDSASKTWLLSANLIAQNGSKLIFHGSAAGGDVDTLRLRSVNTTAANPVVSVQADWGSISIRNTRITSWAGSGPDNQHDNGRAYLRVRSSLGPNGEVFTSRMDILDSDVGYLGYYAAESYGLTWKVKGTPGPFDKVDVLGDVIGSRIHHNYYGIYTYGAYGMRFLDNEVDNNVTYGIDPHDDSDSLVIERNHAHHNGNHGIICSQRCDHLTIRSNRSEFNTGHGIMLHRSVTDSLVENNIVVGNSDTGIPLFESFRNTVRGNTVTGNKYGIRLSVGSADNLIENNTVEGSTAYGLYFYKGSDAPVSGDGRPKRNRFVNNRITDSTQHGLRLSDSDDNTFEANTFANNPNGLLLERGQRNRLDRNTIGSSDLVSTVGTSTTPGLTLFSRLTGPARISVGSNSTNVFDDPDGRVFDPGTTAATSIAPAGSSLTLSPGSYAVTPLNLFADLTSGSATVRATTWSAVTKSFSATTPTSGQNVSYRVGDLAPSALHNVTRNGILVTSATSDANGFLSFSASPGTTSAVTYSVTRAESSEAASLSVDDATVAEGSSGSTNATVTVRRAGDATGTSTVEFATVAGTASSPGDYVSTTGSLTFAAGETSKPVVVAVVPDTVDESDETFTVRLSNASNASIADSEGTVTITDDDEAAPSPTVTFTVSEDATVMRSNPDVNYGSKPNLKVNRGQNFLMKFSAESLRGKTVTSAKIRLNCLDPSDTGGSLHVVSDNSWSERTVTWNTAPVHDPTSMATLGPVTAGGWYEIDITQLVAQEASSGDLIISLKMTSTSRDRADFASKDKGAGFGPQLVAIVTT